MTYKTHMIGGIALASVVHMTTLQMTEMQMIGYYGATLVGALLPDIDHPKSLISQYTLGLHYLFKKCKHRGFTHTLLAVGLLVVGLQVAFGMTPFVGGLGIGYLSHLLLDALNPRGVPLGYPLTKKHLSITKVKTDSNGEYMVLGMLVMVAGYCIYHILT
ncbi:MAG: metal-dependent hydrolase [Cellulosilyticaceae bacterium]